MKTVLASLILLGALSCDEFKPNGPVPGYSIPKDQKFVCMTMEGQVPLFITRTRKPEDQPETYRVLYGSQTWFTIKENP